MTAQVLTADPRNLSPRVIERAREVLLAGGLVAFPTETVYGLGALADDAASVRRIFAAKGRPAHNPLIAHVPDVDAARRVAGAWPEAADRLARAFWPGPLTLVVPRGKDIPDELCAGGPSMALRVPAHPIALALLRAVGRPVAAPSANPSTQLSPTRAEHVVKALGDRVDLVLDGGPCGLGIESTVVDTTSDPPRVLRPGSLTLEDLRRVVPEVAARGHDVVATGTARASPGLDAKHYAPRARLVIAPRDAMAARVLAAQSPVGVITHGAPLGAPGATERTLPADARGYAAELFAELHALDDAGCATIVLEQVPASPEWEAVRDRLARASHG